MRKLKKTLTISLKNNRVITIAFTSNSAKKYFAYKLRPTTLFYEGNYRFHILDINDGIVFQGYTVKINKINPKFEFPISKIQSIEYSIGNSIQKEIIASDKLSIRLSEIKNLMEFINEDFKRIGQK